jgi:hypothetical protein
MSPLPIEEALLPNEELGGSSEKDGALIDSSPAPVVLAARPAAPLLGKIVRSAP